VRAAAVQLEPVIADVDANLEACAALVAMAVRQGAQLVALPEFFTTGAVFDPRLADAVLPPDHGFLADTARRHGIRLGGSYLCRDVDGHVRNAYFLAGPDGELLGRHDKDLPTMWENALYVGGAPDDDGLIEGEGLVAGAAVCWEFMRTQTARRLRGRVDLVVGGSNWWSIPPWPPRAVTRRWAAANEATAMRAPVAFARLVGAPVVHANMSGPIACGMPDVPGVTYRGRFVGAASITDATGSVVAVRPATAGPGVVVADIQPRRSTPLDPLPERFWLHRRGPMPAVVWHTQRLAGRRWYAKHMAGSPAQPGEAPDDVQEVPGTSWTSAR
jgi:predicted amidohydrolase